MKKEDDNDRIDLNLDEEAPGESPLDAAAAAAKEVFEKGEAPAGELPGELEALMQQVSRLKAEKDDLHQTLVRRQADFENFRKRVEKERQEDTRRAAMIVVEGLLPVLDAFERALAAPIEAGFEQHRVGFELIYKQLWEGLARHGLERIEAAGKPFDPFVHQAIERVETSDAPDGTVLEELQRGYKMRDKIIRPSMVRVASNSGPAAQAATDVSVN